MTAALDGTGLLPYYSKLMFLDLHTHSVSSDDSRATVEQFVKWVEVLRRKSYRVDGFVLTEHRKFDADKDYRTLAEENDVVILKGSELDTNQGHFLVYGVTEELTDRIDFSDVGTDAPELIRAAEDCGGIAVPAIRGASASDSTSLSRTAPTPAPCAWWSTSTAATAPASRRGRRADRKIRVPWHRRQRCAYRERDWYVHDPVREVYRRRAQSHPRAEGRRFQGRAPRRYQGRLTPESVNVVASYGVSPSCFVIHRLHRGWSADGRSPRGLGGIAGARGER